MNRAAKGIKPSESLAAAGLVMLVLPLVALVAYAATIGHIPRIGARIFALVVALALSMVSVGFICIRDLNEQQKPRTVPTLIVVVVQALLCAAIFLANEIMGLLGAPGAWAGGILRGICFGLSVFLLTSRQVRRFLTSEAP
jgi:hypothetical protein